MKRSPLVDRTISEPPRVTFATNGPTRDGTTEGEVWSSGDGTHIWRNGAWIEVSELRAEQEKKS